MPPIIRTDVTFIQISQSNSSVHIHSLSSHPPRCFLRRLWGSWETLWLWERQYVTLEHMSTPGASWETDGGAVQQERLNARTVCDRSVSPRRLTVTSGVQRRTHKLIHTEDAQTKQACTDTVWQLRHRCGLLPSSGPSGAPLMELRCRETRGQTVKSQRRTNNR